MGSGRWDGWWPRAHRADGGSAPDGLTPAERIAVVLVVGLGVGTAGTPLVGGSIAAILAAFAVWRRSAVAGCLALAPSGIAVGATWPGSAFVTVGAIWWVLRPGWFSNGIARTPWKTVVLTVGLSGLCAVVAALVVELSIPRPVTVSIDEPPFLLLVVGILVVAAVNSLGEELLWRGVLHGWLTDRASGSRTATVLAPAASFGVAHCAGVPGGPIGVVAAALLGVVLGVARTRSGFVSCVAVHFTVDVAIFSSVAASAIWVGSPAV